jgi:hypothetical protein
VQGGRSIALVRPYQPLRDLDDVQVCAASPSSLRSPISAPSCTRVWFVGCLNGSNAQTAQCRPRRAQVAYIYVHSLARLLALQSKRYGHGDSCW